MGSFKLLSPFEFVRLSAVAMSTTVVEESIKLSSKTRGQMVPPGLLVCCARNVSTHYHSIHDIPTSMLADQREELGASAGATVGTRESTNRTVFQIPAINSIGGSILDAINLS